MLELKAGPMREHDYTTLFKLDHMLKDVRLCLERRPGGWARLPVRRADRGRSSPPRAASATARTTSRR